MKLLRSVLFLIPMATVLWSLNIYADPVAWGADSEPKKGGKFDNVPFSKATEVMPEDIGPKTTAQKVIPHRPFQYYVGTQRPTRAATTVSGQNVWEEWSSPVEKTKNGWEVWPMKHSQYGCSVSNDPTYAQDQWIKIEGFTPDNLRFVWVMDEALATKLSGETYNDPKPREWTGVYVRMTDKRIPGFTSRHLVDEYEHTGEETWHTLTNFAEYGAAGFQIPVTPRFLNYLTGAKEIQIRTYRLDDGSDNVAESVNLKGSREAIKALFRCFEKFGYTFDGYKYKK